ncbi:hypothetical protein LB542_19775 [Mesorhizobium sp. BR1-1-9]|uniref:hypothetical protein n=1 Tax=Mesorhizobium sp. BR1-1-9 TaxID=2876646 RepID=UPI001CD0FE4B|nr:hypothetical protein [Mesorhizobium sp. BR1-1-9]MBZ9873090.1 hypothetical protein [Mesorhizobium sp. BR1-1-9]
MSQNFSGAVLLLILATAGFHTGTPVAWWFAGLAAATAFMAEDARNYRAVHGGTYAIAIATGLALASWAAVAISAISLLV